MDPQCVLGVGGVRGALDALRKPWANQWANLGQTWANLCRFGANLPGDGLRRVRILRKKWDGRHPVIRAKYPYYNTKRGNMVFLLGGSARAASGPTPRGVLEFYQANVF